MAIERDGGTRHNHRGALVSAHSVKRYGAWRYHEPLRSPVRDRAGTNGRTGPKPQPPKTTDHSPLRWRDNTILGRRQSAAEPTTRDWHDVSRSRLDACQDGKGAVQLASAAIHRMRRAAIERRIGLPGERI